MAVLTPVNNSDSGLAARTKINNNDANINSDVGTNTNDIATLQTDKADKVIPSVVDNVALLDATGNLKDSGIPLGSLDLRVGKTIALGIGTHTITFSTPFSDANYVVLPQGYISATGVYAPPKIVPGSEIAASFDVELSLPSIIRYIAVHL